jgi:hypothetical protein
MLRIFCRLTGGAWLPMLAATLVCGCSGKPPPPPKSPPPAPVEIPGEKIYRAGIAAIVADDRDQAQRLLHDAVRLNPGLAEAWFDLGHLEVSMAPGLFKEDELKALVLYREGLQFEQQARKLLDEGRITLWTPAQVDQAREKLDVDLRDADHALTDEESLRESLRLRIY